MNTFLVVKQTKNGWYMDIEGMTDMHKASILRLLMGQGTDTDMEIIRKTLQQFPEISNFVSVEQ
jgi:hypothetical protein